MNKIPCPFCGNPVDIDDSTNLYPITSSTNKKDILGWVIHCKCNFSIFSDSKEELIKLWKIDLNTTIVNTLNEYVDFDKLDIPQSPL